jgi:hypothetical protein
MRYAAKTMGTEIYVASNRLAERFADSNPGFAKKFEKIANGAAQVVIAAVGEQEFNEAVNAKMRGSVAERSAFFRPPSGMSPKPA